jgi:hypothetical protein
MDDQLTTEHRVARFVNRWIRPESSTAVPERRLSAAGWLIVRSQGGSAMTTTIESAATTIRAPGAEFEVDEAQLAAVSFLARHSGRTLVAYRHDLRGFFRWATDHASPSWRRAAPTSSCSAPGWRTAA